MGHYYSEMGLEDWLDREAERVLNRAKKIEKAIEMHGIAYVLAQIVDDATMASIIYDGHKQS